MNQPDNVFEWLDLVRERRSMYAQSLAELESMIHGYYSALDVHQITESVPSMKQGQFGVWLRVETGWSLSAGWAYVIEQNKETDVDGIFQQFFSFVDRYRVIQPTVIATVTLRPEHQPTGKRRKYGHDGLMDRPDEILAINYSPTSLNHLRHRYGNRYVDDWILMLGDGSHQTTVDDLVAWVADEFGVDRIQWNIITTPHTAQHDVAPKSRWLP